MTAVCAFAAAMTDRELRNLFVYSCKFVLFCLLRLFKKLFTLIAELRLLIMPPDERVYKAAEYKAENYKDKDYHFTL